MRFFFIPCLALFTAFGILRFTKDKSIVSVKQDIAAKKNVVGCSPDWQALKDFFEETDIPPMPGAGNYKWNIHATNDSAQFYFNQGINMYYGFHIIEAMASFKKAGRFDPENPLIWWAQALSYGPNINDVGYLASPEALEASNKALELSKNSSPVEKLLIQAMSVRYSVDTTMTRAKLNADYTAAMQTIYLKNINNSDVAALYVDAMMLEHPWELWNNNGTPRAWTPRIREVLEKGLLKTPEHPGMNHYYVHVMEPSPFPEKALASADRLGKLNPGLSHIVHMPSHIYLRTGFYAKGYTVNEEALKQYKKYLDLYPGVINNDFLYRQHNEHMQVNCAMHAGRKEYSIGTALSLQKSIDTSFLSLGGGMGNYMHYMYMLPVLTMIRFEDWGGLIALPSVEEKHVYANLLWHFGRGMAFAGKDNINKAEKESEIINELLKDSSLYQPFAPFSPAVDGALVASAMLKGAIALKKNDPKTAISHFRFAVEKEKNMVYQEPRDWLLNPKNYLATAYFISGDLQAAEKMYTLDLKDNNENVWSLGGLYKTLLKQNKKTAARLVLARLKKASVNSDLSLLQ